MFYTFIKTVSKYKLFNVILQLDDEANKKSNYLLARAQQLRQDQEDEIKRCNSLILSTKCHAIRNAQIAEKQLIQ